MHRRERLEGSFEFCGAGAQMCDLIGRKWFGQRLQSKAFLSSEIEKQKPACAAELVPCDREEPRYDFTLWMKPMRMARGREPRLLKEVFGLARVVRESHEKRPDAWVVAAIQRIECVCFMTTQSGNQSSFIGFGIHVEGKRTRHECVTIGARREFRQKLGHGFRVEAFC